MGTVHIHVSTVQLPYMVINMWRDQRVGGGGNHVQLPYTVINGWSINMWSMHSCPANVHGN